MKIRTRNTAVAAVIEKLHEKVCYEGGAYFDEALELGVKGSELSYSLARKVQNQHLMVSLPVSVMPQIDHYKFRLSKDGSLNVDSIDSDATPLQSEIMMLSLELFNLLGKVSQFGKDSPPVQLSQFPELLNLLLTGGNGADLAQPAVEGDESLRIAAFWQARMFYELNSEANRSLPLLEFMNHHLFANNFKYDFRGGGNHIQLHHKNLIAGQTFARYEIMDALQTFVVYGFVDQSAYFLHSQSFEMPLTDGLTLQVSSQAVCSHQSDVPDWNPPPKFQNSFMYRSKLLYGSSGPVMPYAIVPPGNHIEPFKEATLAQLEEIERHYGLEKGAINNEEVYDRFLRTLYSENLAFYKKLLAELRTIDFKLVEKNSMVPSQFKVLMDKQRGILRGFAKCF